MSIFPRNAELKATASPKQFPSYGRKLVTA